MSFLLYLSDLIVPLIILGIVTYGLSMRINVYDEFIKGAKIFLFHNLLVTLWSLMQR